MNQFRENEAINAYLKLLQSKGASSGVLYMRALFLEKLGANLTGKELDGDDYREALEVIMEMMPADDWHTCLTAAREFYAFWVKDIKAIAAFNLHLGFNIEPLQWKPNQVSLIGLWKSLEAEKFDTAENWPLKAYTQALRYEGAEQSLVHTRVSLAKIILIRLRDAPFKDHKSYRATVDLTLPLFNIKQNRRLFLVVVREFYHFWTGNPDASNLVLKDGPGNML